MRHFLECGLIITPQSPELEQIVVNKMCSFQVVVFVFSLLLLEIAAKTYYFNVNKTSNEFQVYNRVNLNQSQETSYHVAELRNNKEIVPVNTTYPESYLDPEWNYDFLNKTRAKLPTFIHRLYNTLSDKEMDHPTRILFNVLPQNSTVLKFNTAQIEKANVSIDIELHFYHSVPENLFQKPLILRLFQMEHDEFNETSLHNPDTHKLLNVIYIFQAESGWQVFKLSNVMKNWLSVNNDLLLLITASRPNDEHFTVFKDVNRDIFRTFLIVKPELTSNEIATRHDTPVQAHASSYCHKENLFIDFEKINWNALIIAPRGVNVHACNGRCYKKTIQPNYVKIASLNGNYNRKHLCCAPISYKPMIVMFYNRYGDVIVKSYDRLVVTECGCR